MQSFPADPSRNLSANQISPALMSFADELCATIARLFAYVGTFALIGMLAIHGWDQLQIALSGEPAPEANWSTGEGSHSVFDVGELDPSAKSETYTIFRHPLGGRKDVLRWTGTDGKARAETERGASPVAPATSEDWITGPQNPQLRGSF